MKRIIRIIFALIIIGIVVKFVGPDLFKPTTIRAFGDLTVNFHVPVNDPIFVVNNMAPGDPAEIRNVDVSNGGSITHLIRVKGVRTGGIGADPKLESVLNIVINNGTSDVYGGSSGAKTVADFFADSLNPDGIALGNIDSGNAKTYTFTVNFPSTAGNEFQGKSVIFDLIFGDGTEPTPTPTNTPTPTATNTPTPTPTSKPTPTPSGNLCGNINVNIFGNGSGSVNGVFIVCKNFKVVSQTNSTSSTTKVTSVSNTGGNTSNNNTNSSTSIKTGGTITTIITNILGGKNINH